MLPSEPGLELLQEILCKTRNGSVRILTIGAGCVGSLSSIILAFNNPKIKFTVCDNKQGMIKSWCSGDFPFIEPEI